MPVTCPVCHRENRATATFCQFCGARLPAAGGPAEAFDVEAEAHGAHPDHDAQSSGVASEPAAAPPPDLSTVRLVPPTDREEQEGAPSSDQEPTGPLQVGDTVAGRFEVVEILESTPEINRYRARDWGRCAACGYDDNTRGDRFCLDCGASLDVPVWATLTELVRRRPHSYDLALCERDREYFVTLEQNEAASSEPRDVSGTPLTLRWGASTDTGQQRDHNEDYVDCWSYSQGGSPVRASGTVLGLFVVADGLGGQDSGEVASRMAVEEVWRTLRQSVWEPILTGPAGARPAADAVQQALRDAVQAANRAVFEARQAAGSQMSTTVTTALVVDRTAYVANVGDSRTYHFGADGLCRITRDHSLVQRLLDAGRISQDEAYSHPQRNLIYQSVGDRPTLEVDLFDVLLAPGDRLVLCSDGLWEMVRDEGIQDVLMAEADPQRACDALVRHANLAGGEDNITVVVVQAMGA